MTPEQFRRARELFDRAVELPEAERSLIVALQCGDDRELATIVHGLLERARRQQTERAVNSSSQTVDQLLGTPIGPYRIRTAIGQGGMGAVYEAEHMRTRQVVALKLIRPGLTTPALLRRFEFELQVLARLEYPGIARIYHADTADIGGGPQPYFAMELVRGQNLIQHVTEQKLSIRQRLELTAKIADAVQYAHQHGVIHRDLKPGNIYVTAEGQPKILDFGVARATDSDVQSTTLQTDIGQLIGTLPYMSPEQADGDPNQIDTRSDVYSLGVILYELLTGRLPYLLEHRLIHEVVRIIKEEEPTRLSSLNKTLRGDVETIVGKSLEKEKDRRYASANAVAADIRRYLSDEPIAARSPSATYQLGKFARRNKVLVGGAAATFVVLVAGLSGTGFSLNRVLIAESRERNEKQKVQLALAAEEKARALAQENQKLAEKRAEETKQVADFQESMLAQIDPATAGVRLTEDVNRRYEAALEKLGVQEAERKAQANKFRQQWLRVNATDVALALLDETILKPSVSAIDEKFKNQPLIDAQLHEGLATRYVEFGIYDTALRLQSAALETRRRVQGDEHPDTLTAVANWGFILLAVGKASEAEQYYREALEQRRRVLGEEHRDTLRSLNNMGFLLMDKGNFQDAEACLRAALEKKRHALGNNDPDTLGGMNNLGSVLQQQGKLDEAELYFREALEKRRRVLGENHPNTLESLGNLGRLLRMQGKLAEAELYYREVLEKSRRIFGDDHPTTLNYENNMGYLLQVENKLDEAEPYYRDALEKRRRVLGDEHPDTIISIDNMGYFLEAQGRLAEAEPYVREALERFRRQRGVEHPDTLIATSNLGSVLLAQRRLGEAEVYNREALEKSRHALGEEHQQTLIRISNLAVNLYEEGKLAEAEAYFWDLLAKSSRVLGDEDVITLASKCSIASILKDQGKPQEAIEFLEPIEGAARKMFTGSNIDCLAQYLLTLGDARVDVGFEPARFAKAESNLAEAYGILEKLPHRQGRDICACMEHIVALFHRWNDAEPGKGFDAKAAEWRAKLAEWHASTRLAAEQSVSSASTKPAEPASPTSNPANQP